MYLDKNFKEVTVDMIETHKSGLFAMNRKKEVVQIKIPKNSLAFQVGESS